MNLSPFLASHTALHKFAPDTGHDQCPVFIPVNLHKLPIACAEESVLDRPIKAAACQRQGPDRTPEPWIN